MDEKKLKEGPWNPQEIAGAAVEDELHLWGGRIQIVKQHLIEVRERILKLLIIDGNELVQALCELFSFVVIAEDEQNNLLAIIDRQLIQAKLSPQYWKMSVPIRGTEKCSDTLLLWGIDEFSERIWSLFPEFAQGLLVFVNGLEPAGGTLPLQDVYPKTGDRIQLIHIIEKRELGS